MIPREYIDSMRDWAKIVLIFAPIIFIIIVSLYMFAAYKETPKD